MATVNENDDSSTPTLSFQSLPGHPLGCITPGCPAYHNPKQSQLLFWRSPTTPNTTLLCPRCESDVAPVPLFRRQGTWNNPYYGFAIALFSGVIVWLLPYKLLPWSQTIKIGISALCAMTVVSLVLQLAQRSQRLKAFALFEGLGEPANLPAPPELSLKLEEDLQGKIASLDGRLKGQLLDLIGPLRSLAHPALQQEQYALAQLQRTSLDELNERRQQARLTPEEQRWSDARLAQLATIQRHKEAIDADAALLRDLFDSIADHLESLKYGDHAEKEEARDALAHSLTEGHELIQRIEQRAEGDQ